MHYYAQLNKDRIAFGVSQLAAPVDAPDMIALESYDTTVLGMRYVPASGTFAPVPEGTPAPQQRRLSILGFRRRFTPAERAAIEWAAVDRSDQPLAQRQQAAALRATLADQAASTFIDLDDEDTVAGVQSLEAMGLLTPGRAIEIITDPIQPEELP